MNANSSMITRTPDQTKTIEAFGDKMILHLGTEETAGQFCLWTNITPPGGGPPPHFHENEDELFLPLSGDAEFLIDGTWKVVPAKLADSGGEVASQGG